jgi:transcription antitermination factor NusG
LTQWLVLRVQSQRELEAEREIRDLGFDAAAPYVENWIRVHGRPRKRKAALFTGYVFVGLDDIGAGWQEISRVLNKPGHDRIAYGFVGTGGVPAAMRPEDVVYVRTISGGRYQRDQETQRQLSVGDEVLLPKGILEGFSGRILAIKRGKTATIELKRQAITRSVEIDLAKLNKA